MFRTWAYANIINIMMMMMMVVSWMLKLARLQCLRLDLAAWPSKRLIGYIEEVLSVWPTQHRSSSRLVIGASHWGNCMQNNENI